MVHHYRQILLLCKVDQFLSLRGIARKWFFNEYVLTIFQNRLCQVIVGPDWGYNRNGIDLSRRDDG